MNVYPVHLNLRGRRCVVVGGGRVAARKAASLLDAGAGVVVVSPRLTPVLAEHVSAGRIMWISALYDAGCLEGAFLVFAATNDSTVNAQIVADAQARGIPVNSATDPDAGDFATPGVVRRGELTLSVSTGGASPTLSAVVREDLAAQFGPEWEYVAELFARLRPDIQSLPDEARRRAAVRRVLSDLDVHAHLSAGDADGAELLARPLVLKTEALPVTETAGP